MKNVGKENGNGVGVFSCWLVIALALVCLAPGQSTLAQDITVDAKAQAEIIDSISATLNSTYVFPDVAEKLYEFLVALGGQRSDEISGVVNAASNGVILKCFPEAGDAWHDFCEANIAALDEVHKAGIKKGQSILAGLQSGELTVEQISGAATKLARKSKMLEENVTDPAPRSRRRRH